VWISRCRPSECRNQRIPEWSPHTMNPSHGTNKGTNGTDPPHRGRTLAALRSNIRGSMKSFRRSTVRDSATRPGIGRSRRGWDVSTLRQLGQTANVSVWEGRRGRISKARGAWAGNRHSPASEGLHGLSNPWTLLRRTHPPLATLRDLGNSAAAPFMSAERTAVRKAFGEPHSPVFDERTGRL
jgi:hypothetical protein